MLPFKKRRRFSAVQIIVLFYFTSVVISTGVLSIPYLHKPDAQLTFMDALFTAVSAISVTGLTVVNTADTFNSFGRLMLALIFQIGGIGIMSIGTFLWILLGRRVGLSGRQWIAIDQNRPTLSGLVSLIQAVLIMTIMIEATGTVILGGYFLFQGYLTTWQEAFFYGFFSSVSAFTNSGFDIFGDSLYRFSTDYFVQTVHMTLIILGAVGFPVLMEVRAYLGQRHREGRFRFSLYTKLTTSTFFGLTVVGAVLFFLFEKNAFLAGEPWHAAIVHSLFHSVTARSCGVSTVDINGFSEPTLFLLSILMFIGASPSSVGGGIRTTTFIVLILTVVAFMRGRSEVFVFRRELHQEDIRKAFVVFFVGVSLVSTATISLLVFEPFPLLPLLFEVCSAFGTTGISMGITSELSHLGQSILIFLMFVGRVGVIPFLILLKRDKRLGYHYPKERMIIG
ncbi:Ktr system potassium uptake protein D [Ammoniphilus oxalaticus]|uniref:Ktr system potassium uptake protein D n=1 Tax=Ammoniphilus oxalaticus TaxID=66863 RepID=A0A419SM00_9BACL|nr:potassium transporter TrkG [Ammoniphilus oxalaticus]RKD25097.1 Ktr system potassium uptake protein D [Ammoniphilus oxalaticus]